MREYFRPWQRKAGVVMLGLACVFLAGLVRSSHFNDNLWTIVGQDGDWASIGLLSIDQQFGVVHLKPHGPGPVTQRCGWDELPIARGRARWNSVIDFNHHWLGFGYSNSVHPSMLIKAVIVPYWSIVLPLTLLSAYLLLSKPRPAKKPAPTQPTEPDHA
jgi:hypothetical protein